MDNTKQIQGAKISDDDLLTDTQKTIPKKHPSDELDEYLDNDFLNYVIGLKNDLKTTQHTMRKFKKRNLDIQRWIILMEINLGNLYSPTKCKLHYVTDMCYYELLRTIIDCRKEIIGIGKHEEEYYEVIAESINNLIDMIYTIVQVLTPELRLYYDI